MKEVEPITTLIHEEGRPADGKDWSKYKRVVVEVPPTVNHREAAIKADEILEVEKKKEGV